MQDQVTVRQSPAPASGLSKQLAQLAALRDTGVLDETEFAAAKRRLLGLQGADARRRWTAKRCASGINAAAECCQQPRQEPKSSTIRERVAIRDVSGRLADQLQGA